MGVEEVRGDWDLIDKSIFVPERWPKYACEMEKCLPRGRRVERREEGERAGEGEGDGRERRGEGGDIIILYLYSDS